MKLQHITRTRRTVCMLMSGRPPIPTEERKPVWRGACLAYREMRQAGASDHEAHEAAVAAVQEELPLPYKEASAEALNPIAYATGYHPEWFWQGLAKLTRQRHRHCGPVITA